MHWCGMATFKRRKCDLLIKLQFQKAVGVGFMHLRLQRGWDSCHGDAKSVNGWLSEWGINLLPAKWINLWLLNLIVFSHLSIYFEFMAFFRDNKSIENYFTKVKIMFSFLKLKVHLSGFNIDNK